MTVTGEGVFDVAIVADNGDAQFNVGLPGRAPVALTNSTVNFAPHAVANDDDATRTGSAAAPTAPAGKVCIYIVGTAGLDTASGSSVSYERNRYFNVYFLANGTAGLDMYIDYRWAYTAP